MQLPDVQPKPGLIGHINARSALAHATELHDLVLEQQLQILAISETWVKPSSTPNLHDLIPNHYKFISKPRLGKTGGGVAILHHESIFCNVIPINPEPSSFEGLLVKGLSPGHQPITFLTLYHPPEDHAIFLEELQLLLENLSNLHTRLIVWGDFNIHCNVDDDPHTVKLLSMMENLHFKHYLSDPTHKLGHQLDLMFEHQAPLDNNCTITLPWGDHFLLQACLVGWLDTNNPKSAKPIKERISIRSYKSLTPQLFSTTWVPCHNSLRPAEDLDAILHTKLILARNQFCPIRLVTRKKREHLHNKWFDDDLKKLRSKGRAIHRAWNKSHSRSDLLRWQKHQALYKLRIKKAKREFIQSHIVASKNSSRALFQLSSAFFTPPGTEEAALPSSLAFCQGIAHFFHTKVKTIRDDLETMSIDPEMDKAQALISSRSKPTLDPDSMASTHFSDPSKPTPSFKSFTPVSQAEVRKAILHLGPSSSSLDPLPTSVLKLLLEDILPDITNLVNASLAEGRVPEAWKKGVVTPLLKKAGLDPTDFKNYCPVTQLRFMARLIEHIVTQKIQTYLELHHILHDNQSGFRPGRSTEAAVADIRETLLRGADQNHPTILLLLDLSAAFDTVDHSILCARLEEAAGISGTVKAWIASFLSERVQIVRCGDVLSSEIPVPYGVPQGSSLSPVLFNLYMQPLAHLLDSIGLPFQCYADDTQITVDLHEETGQACRLVPALIVVKEWMRKNKLKLNEDKTEILGFPSPQGTPLPPIPWPTSWGPQPPISSTSRDLGVLIDKNLDGSAQASAMVRTSHHHLGLLLKLFPLLTTPQKISLYYAFVGSRLSYGLLSLLGAPVKTIQQLQKVQNRAIRSIFSLPWREHISPWRQKLGWLSIASLISFRICVWIWKALQHQGPKYIRDWLDSRRNNYLQRSALRYNIPPRAIKKARKGGRTIGHKGAQIWNRVPASIRCLPTLTTFKVALKEHLMSKEAPGQKSPPSSGHGTDRLLPSVRDQKPFRSAPPCPGATLPTSPSSATVIQARAPTSSDGRSIPWGLSSPPLPRRNNLHLITIAARNKQRLIQSGHYPQR